MMVQLLASIAFLFAQAPTPAPPPAAPAQPGSAYIVGANDVLGIKVLGEAELSTQYTVDSDGTITFPYLQRVPVAGKTVAEIEYAIRKGLEDDWIRNPQVSVVVTSFRSRAIFVLGEVRNPAKYTIEGQTTLLEVIAQAGSFTPNAAQTLSVIRYKDGMTGVAAGTPVAPGDPRGAEIVRINREELAEGRLQANIILQDGDTIYVPAAEKFYVQGYVKQPGQFVLQPGMTVRQAIAVAGGLSERGTDRRIKIIRKVNNKDVEIDAELSTLILPNDTIRIQQRRL
jgi:polysaccharide export outer membrane protein